MAETKTADKTDAAATVENSGRRDPTGKFLIGPDGRPLDQAETGAAGMALPPAGEHAGGAIADELIPDAPAPETADPLWKQRRYMSSKLATEAGTIIGRAPENIGLWGDGDTYRGTGILVNIDSMDKVRVYDGYRFDGKEVYANSRDLPAALVNGDIAKNLSGKR